MFTWTDIVGSLDPTPAPQSCHHGLVTLEPREQRHRRDEGWGQQARPASLLWGRPWGSACPAKAKGVVGGQTRAGPRVPPTREPADVAPDGLSGSSSCPTRRRKPFLGDRDPLRWPRAHAQRKLVTPPRPQLVSGRAGASLVVGSRCPCSNPLAGRKHLFHSSPTKL